MKPLTGIAISSGMFLLGLGIGGMWKGMDLEAALRHSNEAATGFNQRIQTLEGAVTELSKEREQTQSLLQQKEQQAKDLERKVSEVEGRLALALKQRPQATPEKEPGQPTMKVIAEMMKTPAMREVFKQQQVATVELSYGGLFKRLRLNQSEREDLKKLIAERVEADTEFVMRAMGDDLPPNELQASQKALKEAQNASSVKIKTFLNNEQDYQAYQNWEQSKPERMAISMGQSVFAGAGEPLTSAQEDQLANAMMGARTRRTDIPDLTKPENILPGNINSLPVEKILASYDSQALEVAAAAAAFLSPKQLEVLKLTQQQQKSFQEMGLKMIGATGGGKK